MKPQKIILLSENIAVILARAKLNFISENLYDLNLSVYNIACTYV